MMLTSQEQRSRSQRQRPRRRSVPKDRLRTTVATTPAVVTTSARLAAAAVVVVVAVIVAGGSGSGVQALSMLASPPTTAATTTRGGASSSSKTVVPDAAPTTPLLPSWKDDVWRKQPSARVPSSLVTVPSDDGIDIELPNFARILEEIRSVSPLANKVMSTTMESAPVESTTRDDDDAYLPTIQNPWKLVENSHNQRTGQRLRIDKIDNYQGRTSSAPLLRFRTHIKGPCIGECFAQFIMDHKYRSQWDAQIDQVYEAHSVNDHLSTVQRAMNLAHHQLAQEIKHQQSHDDMIIPNWGTCSKFGVGYCKTKASIVSPREQLTLCGIQDYLDGSCLIWGVEMDQSRHDHLMPTATNQPGRGRSAVARAKSHLFCTTLTPRPTISGPMMSFDVEYLLQLEIGGKLPAWISGPVVTENVKQLLSCATNFFAGTDSHRGLETYLLERAAQAVEVASESSDHTSSTMLRPVETYMEGRHGLLMTF